MIRPRHHKSVIYALYVNAALFFAILIVLLNRGGSGGLLPSASAAPLAPAPIAGNGNLYVMPAQLLTNVWGCYILDTDSQILTAYSYNGNQLKLVASRNVRFDHQLGSYNTHPDPEEIRKLVEIEREKIRGVDEPGKLAPSTGPAAKP